jgi:hypothetical protein
MKFLPRAYGPSLLSLQLIPPPLILQEQAVSPIDEAQVRLKATSHRRSPGQRSEGLKRLRWRSQVIRGLWEALDIAPMITSHRSSPGTRLHQWWTLVGP